MSDGSSSLNVFVEALTPELRDLWVAKTDAEFNAAFSANVLKAVHELQADSKNLAGNNEGGLNTILRLAINGTRILTATREEFSNGHVDLVFRASLCKPPRKVLGEAKIFKYYEWHVSGLSQLVDRYSTGREDRALLLEYVKLPEIKAHMDNLRSEMDQKRPCQQIGKCSDHETVPQWSFCSTHSHSSGEAIEVWHLGCNLHVPVKTKPSKPKRP